MEDTPALVNKMFGSWWGLFEFIVIILTITVLSLIGALVVDSYFFRDKTTGNYKSTDKEGDFLTRNLSTLFS